METREVPNLVINPTRLHYDEQLILSRYLVTTFHHSGGLLIEDVSYEAISLKDGLPFHFSLTHSLLWRQCNHDPHQCRYEIFSYKYKIGEGSFSRVYDGFGTLVPEPRGGLTFKPSHYVIKMQCHNNEPTSPFSISEVVKEYDLSKSSGIRIKQPTIVKHDNGEIESYLVMECFLGSTLFKILCSDRKRGFLTINLLIRLSIRILQAYQSQIQKNALVHRDIKPENIIVNMDIAQGQIFYVRFLDFGLGKHIMEVDVNHGGNLFYASLESKRKENTDYTSDIYSLGKLLAVLWHANQEMTPENYKKCEFKNLFNHPKFRDLIETHKTLIRYLLEGMTELDKQKRPTVEDAIELLEIIELNRQFSILSKTINSVVLDNANANARQFRLVLHDMAKRSLIKDEKNALTHILSLKSVFHAGLKMADIPCVVNHFINIAGINDFFGLKSLKQIKERVNHIFKSVIHTLYEIETFSPQRKKSLYARFKNDICMPLTFDNLIQLNKKLVKAIVEEKNMATPWIVKCKVRHEENNLNIRMSLFSEKSREENIDEVKNLRISHTL